MVGDAANSQNDHPQSERGGMNTSANLKEGDWVLAFDQPYFPPGADMSELLTRFTTWGGGWDGHAAEEIFVVHQVRKVMPKTYLAECSAEAWPASKQYRFSRENIIQPFVSAASASEARDRFHAIGVRATTDIEREAKRLIKPYATEREARALDEIRACFPSIFGVRK